MKFAYSHKKVYLSPDYHYRKSLHLGKLTTPFWVEINIFQFTYENTVEDTWEGQLAVCENK